MKHKLAILVVAVLLLTASPGVLGADVVKHDSATLTDAVPLRDTIEAGLASGPVLLFFYSPHCGGCAAVRPGIARLEQELAGTASVVQVDVNLYPQEAYTFGVAEVPALFVVTAIDQDGYTYSVVPADLDSKDFVDAIQPLRPVRTGYCRSCSECSTMLASGNYDVVKLINNIKQVGGSCVSLLFGESNVVFDCDGHFIDGDDIAIDPDHGVAMMHGSNNTIRNCTISDFSRGIYVVDATDHTVRDNTLTSNGSGLHLSYANSGNVHGNVIVENYTGIYISNSSSNTITGNRVCDNTVTDFNLSSGAGNSGTNNTCDTPGAWNDTGTTGCSHPCGGYWLCLPVVLQGG